MEISRRVLALLALAATANAFKLKILFLEFSEKGVQAKPALSLGYEDKNTDFEVGIPNVQNGLGFRVTARGGVTFEGEGRDLNEALEDLKSKDGEVVGALADLLKGSKAKDVNSVVNKATRQMSSKENFTDIRKRSKVFIKLTKFDGIDGTVRVFLPWKNEKGYTVVGGEALGIGGLAMGFKNGARGTEEMMIVLKTPGLPALEIRFAV